MALTARTYCKRNPLHRCHKEPDRRSRYPLGAIGKRRHVLRERTKAYCQAFVVDSFDRQHSLLVKHGAKGAGHCHAEPPLTPQRSCLAHGHHAVAQNRLLSKPEPGSAGAFKLQRMHVNAFNSLESHSYLRAAVLAGRAGRGRDAVWNASRPIHCAV